MIPIHTVSAQPIDDIEIRKIGDDASVRILLDRPLIYQRHFPWRSGDTLVIFLKDTVAVTSPEPAQRISKRPPGGRDLPLRDISFERDTEGNPRLEIRFINKIEYVVRYASDNRSVDIRLLGLGHLVKISKREARLEATTRKFVVNLESSLRPIGRVAALPKRYKPYGPYVWQVNIDGRTWYRLRLGLFPTQAAAEKARAELADQFPAAWVDLASEAEMQRTTRRVVRQVPKPDIKKAPAPPPVTTARPTDARALIESARQAITRKENNRAISLLVQVLRMKDTDAAPEAQELLGLAYEKSGKTQQAIIEYKLFLKQHPRSEGAERVRQRLLNLEGVPEAAPRATPESRKRESFGQFFGTFSQIYYRGNSKTDTTTTTGSTAVDEPTLTELDQSSLITSLNLTGRYRTQDFDNRFVFSGDHDYDDLNDESRGRVRKAYLESRSQTYNYTFKLGRQSGRYGVLGRFDGLLAGYQITPKWRANILGGAPDDEVAEDSERKLWGLSVDAGTFAGSWAGALYFVNQEIDGFVDRQAVGTELRYFQNNGSAYSLIDYDLHFDDLNIFLFQANYQSGLKTSFNILFDYRNNPTLQLSNALLGEAVQSINGLLEIYTEEEIRQLALDRTSESRVASFGVVQPLLDGYQVGMDYTVTNVSGLPASGTLPATEGTGNISTIVARLIVSELLMKNELTLLGGSYTTSDVFEVSSIFLTERIRFGKNWRLDLNWRGGTRTNSNGSEVTRSTPSLRMDYKLGSVTFEAEYGQETTESTTDTVEETNVRDYFSLGYRWDF